MEIVIYDKAYEFIQELPQSFLSRYQTSLEVSMKGSDYKCHKTNLKHGRSYKDSPNWIRDKKAIINPINNDDQCFQNAATVTLNHEEIGRNSQRITKNEAKRGRNDWGEQRH